MSDQQSALQEVLDGYKAPLLRDLRTIERWLQGELHKVRKAIISLEGRPPRPHPPVARLGGTYDLLRRYIATLAPGGDIDPTAALNFLRANNWRTTARNPDQRMAVLQALNKMSRTGEIDRGEEMGEYRKTGGKG